MHSRRPIRITLCTALALPLLALSSLPAAACSGRRIPEADRLGEFKEVLIGEVTGIHLTDYEAYELGEAELLPTGSTPGYTAYVLLDRVYAANASRVVELELGGCLVKIPQLHERGLFLISKDGGYAIPVWESDEPYTRLLRAATGFGAYATPSPK